MARIEEVEVPISFTMTDKSKALVRSLIAEIMEETNIVFPTEDKLRAFIRTEVRKALANEIKRASSNYGKGVI